MNRFVIAAPDGFFCGICQTQFQMRNLAQKCVYQCLLKSPDLVKVNPVLSRGMQLYQCSICLRQYEEPTECERCLQRCQKEIKSKLGVMHMTPVPSKQEPPKEAKAEKLVKPPTTNADPNQHKFSQDGARYVCNRCQKKYFSRAEVYACYDQHTDNTN